MKYTIIALVLGILVFAGVFVLWQMDKTGEQVITPNTTQNTQDQTGQVAPANQKPTAQNTGGQQGAVQQGQVAKADPTAHPNVAKAMGLLYDPNNLGDYYNKITVPIEKMAVVSSTVDISNCSPNPPIMRVKVGESYTVVNNDSVVHTLISGGNFVVPAKSQKSYVTNITRGGIYPYSCDNKIVGIFINP